MVKILRQFYAIENCYSVSLFHSFGGDRLDSSPHVGVIGLDADLRTGCPARCPCGATGAVAGCGAACNYVHKPVESDEKL